MSTHSPWLLRMLLLWQTSFCTRVLMLVMLGFNGLSQLGHPPGWLSFPLYFELHGAGANVLAKVPGATLHQLSIFLYPLAQRSVARGAIEMALAWFVCSVLEQHVDRRTWVLTVLAGVTLQGIAGILLAHALSIEGTACGAGLVAALAAGELARRHPRTRVLPDLSPVTFMQMRHAVVAYGLLAELFRGHKFGAVMWLLTYLSPWLQPARVLQFLKVTFSGPPERPPMESPPDDVEAQAEAALPGPADEAQKVAPSVAGAPAARFVTTQAPRYDVRLLAFPQRHAEPPAELLRQRFGVDPQRAAQLLAALPWVIKKDLTLSAAQELAQAFRALGADVEVLEQPNASGPAVAAQDTPQRAGTEPEEAALLAGEVACPWCARPVPRTAKLCAHCQRSLLLDLFVIRKVDDARERYRLARALSEGALRVDFAAARAVLDTLRPPLLAALTRAQADDATHHLTALGLTVVAKPAAASLPPPAGHKRGGMRMRVTWQRVGLAGAGLLMVTAAVREFFWRRDGAALSASAIAEDVLPSIVTISCEGQTGAGFFVEPHRIVTNAHVLCPSRVAQARSYDGRKLKATVIERDKDHDLALVEVEEEGKPLPLGDATRARTGDVVYLVGNPQGLEFSLARGLIGHARRNFGEVVLIQVDAAVNPGNSGGPLVDEQGRVIGVVTLKAREAEGVGFAVPINYAYEAASVLALTAPPDTNEELWSEIHESSGEAARKDYAEQLDHPVLIKAACKRKDDGVMCTRALVGVASESPTEGGTTFLLESGDERCELPAHVREWVPVRKQRQADHPLLGKGYDKLLYVSVAEFTPLVCELDDESQAELIVSDGLQGSDRLVLEEVLKPCRDTWCKP